MPKIKEDGGNNLWKQPRSSRGHDLEESLASSSMHTHGPKQESPAQILGLAAPCSCRRTQISANAHQAGLLIISERKNKTSFNNFQMTDDVFFPKTRSVIT